MSAGAGSDCTVCGADCTGPAAPPAYNYSTISSPLPPNFRSSLCLSLTPLRSPSTLLSSLELELDRVHHYYCYYSAAGGSGLPSLHGGSEPGMARRLTGCLSSLLILPYHGRPLSCRACAAGPTSPLIFTSLLA